MKPEPVIVAIDGTSASGKSTAARMAAETLGFAYVDTGAMYRALAWHCLGKKINPADPKAVGLACRRWKTSLECHPGPPRQVRLLVDGYFPETEIRRPDVTAAASHVASAPKVRAWMKQMQRECARFGSLVMEGRDIGTNVFPETNFKFYLDASPAERHRRRQAEGVADNLADRDQRDSQRASAPLMIGLGAFVIDTSGRSPAETHRLIIDEFQRRQALLSQPP